MKRTELLTTGLSPCLCLFIESLVDEDEDLRMPGTEPGRIHPGPSHTPAPSVAICNLATGRALNSIVPAASALVENL